MPNIPIKFHPSAASEVDAAAQWYAERSPAARAFVAEVNACVERVQEAPHRWPRYVHDTRRYLFPNSLSVLSIGFATEQSKSSQWHIIGGDRATGEGDKSNNSVQATAVLLYSTAAPDAQR